MGILDVLDMHTAGRECQEPFACAAFAAWWPGSRSSSPGFEQPCLESLEKAGRALGMTANGACLADSVVRENSAEVSKTSVGNTAGLGSFRVHHDLLAWDSRLVQAHPGYRDCSCHHEKIVMIRVVGWGHGEHQAQMSWVPFHAFGAGSVSVFHSHIELLGWGGGGVQ